MTIFKVKTVFGVEIDTLTLLKILIGDSEWRKEVMKNEETKEENDIIPILSEIEEYEECPIQTEQDGYAMKIDEFVNSHLIGEEYRKLSMWFAKGERHEHSESIIVIGKELFSSSVECPGSTCTFSMDDFDIYREKIMECKQTITELFKEEDYTKFDMYSVADDCQCCS